MIGAFVQGATALQKNQATLIGKESEERELGPDDISVISLELIFSHICTICTMFSDSHTLNPASVAIVICNQFGQVIHSHLSKHLSTG